MADMNVGFGKKSNVLLTGFKAGLKKESLKTEQEKSVFDAIDKDKNGVLDENEVQNFTKALDASNDGKVSRKEAKAFLKGNNLDLKKKEVLNFLKANINNTENVESAKSVQQDGKTVVQVTYKDGSVETINPDKSSELATTDADGNVKTQYKDENGVLTKDRLEKKDGDKTVSTLETDYAQDGKTPTQSVEQDLENNSTTTILYKSGTPESKKVKQGTTTSNYSYNANGAYVLESKIENEGIPAKEKRTKYTYNENGTTTENIIEPGLKRETTRTISDDGIVEDIVDGNGTKTHNIKNKNDKKLTQTKTDANGKEYSIKYDGNGNTLGIVVQNGEKLEIIAKKFGVTVEDLKKVNADVLNGKNEFSVGDEIKIPKEVEADDKNIQGRKSADEAKAEYKKEQEIKRRKAEQAALRRQQQAAQAAARRAQAAAREAQYKAMGLKNHKGQGKPIVGTYKGGKKEQFTIIGEAGYGRHLARRKDGKVVTIAHDGVILKDSYVQATNLYGSGKKIKGKIKDKTGKLITKNYVEIPGAKLPHGRKAVVDEKGRTWVMSHDGVILDNNYVAKSNAADVIRTDSKTAQKAAIGMLESELNNAQKAFNAQMDKDGWAADVADGVSNIWGWAQKDGNQAWRVRRDLKTYRSQLNELKAAASKGDAQFRAKFKQIYGVDYNQNAIANYTMHPTEANFKKAFGTKNDIGTRVAKYNESQDAGAAVVKTTAEVGAGIALAAATVATGGAAGVVASAAVIAGTTMAADVVVETTDRMSSHNGLQQGDMSEIMQGATTDGAIAGLTFGVGKYAKTVYKAGKAVYATSRATSAATRATVAVEKTTIAAARSETIAAKALNVTQQSSAKALGETATVAEKALAKVETKAGSVAAKAETPIAKIESQGASSTATSSVGLSKTEDAVIDTVADGVVGATAEYVETGDVTISGTAMNMAVGSIGIVGTKVKGSKIYQKVKDGVSDAFQGAKTKVGDAAQNVKSKFTSGSTPETGLNAKTSKTHNSTHANESHSAQGKAETHSKTNSENSTNTENKANSTNTENNVHNETKSESKTSTEKLNERMSKLESSIQEGEFAQKIKTNYSDILDSNYSIDFDNKTDIDNLKIKLRELVKEAHPDRGGSTEISQIANDIYSNLRTKDVNKIKQSLAQLESLLNDKTKNLTRQKAELNQLKSMYGTSSSAKAKSAAETSSSAQAESVKDSAKTSQSANTNQAKGSSNTQGAQQANQKAQAGQSQNASSKKNFENLSDEIENTFGYKFQKDLSENLKVGRAVHVNKGDTHYVIKNNNGKIEIISKTPRVEVNFDIPLSNRTPNGKANSGIKMSDALLPEQKAVYTNSYQAFMDTKNKKISHTHSNTISTDNVLHGTSFDALMGKGGILDNGLIPREFSGKTAAHYADGTIPDTLTPLCTDVWDVKQNQSIKSYFDGNNAHWQNVGESNFLPNSHSTASPFVVIIDTKSIDPTIMNNSFGVNNQGHSILFKNGNMSRGHNYPTHRAIPVGAPTNSIEKIVVDTRMASKDQIAQLQNKIAQQGLDIKLYDMNGVEL